MVLEQMLVIVQIDMSIVLFCACCSKLMSLFVKLSHLEFMKAFKFSTTPACIDPPHSLYSSNRDGIICSILYSKTFSMLALFAYSFHGKATDEQKPSCLIRVQT